MEPMHRSGWPVFSASFLVVLLALGGGYAVLERYTPPASATAPATPEVRQLALYLHAFEAGDGTIRHWIPSLIAVNAEDSVILRVTNMDPDKAHGFSIAALNVSVPPIPSGQTVTVRFVAHRPGIYQYGCTLAGCALDHANQTGQFVVLSGR